MNLTNFVGSLANFAVNHISRKRAEDGGVFAVTRDVYQIFNDREDGYTEVCVAKEGDTVEVVELDSTDPGKVRVLNNDNGNEVVYVPLDDLEEF